MPATGGSRGKSSLQKTKGSVLTLTLRFLQLKQPVLAFRCGRLPCGILAAVSGQVAASNKEASNGAFRNSSM